MKTLTGKLPIGFRRGGYKWHRDLDALLSWALENDLEVIDLGRDGDQTARQALDAGMRIGSVDLPEWQGMISPDKGRRADALARNAEYVRACAAFGPMNHFVVMVPERADLRPIENWGYLLDSYGQLAPVLEENGARLVIEGWPGPGALCCTPEGYRELFKEISSPVMGINYDPSHLIRQGIDPIRFLREFGERVYHIHGKDTELLPEGLYEYGSERPAILAPRIPFGGFHWRYTIPGHGVMRWKEAFRILEEKGYAGCVSIELEDAAFYGDADLERMGILQGARFLAGC